MLLVFCFSQKGEVLPTVCLECYLLGTFLWLFFVALRMPEQGVIYLKNARLHSLSSPRTFSVSSHDSQFLPPSVLLPDYMLEHSTGTFHVQIPHYFIQHMPESSFFPLNLLLLFIPYLC